MTPDPLNDPVVNYGWRRIPVEEKFLLPEDEVMVLNIWEKAVGTAIYPGACYRRRIQPPPGHELIGLDEIITDNGGFNGKTPREVLKDHPYIFSFFRLFRPIKAMSETKEYHYATKTIVSYDTGPDAIRHEEEKLLGYFEGDGKIVYKFLEENGHYPFRLHSITFRQVTQETVDQLIAAKKSFEDAEAALKAIKV